MKGDGQRHDRTRECEKGEHASHKRPPWKGQSGIIARGYTIGHTRWRPPWAVSLNRSLNRSKPHRPSTNTSGSAARRASQLDSRERSPACPMIDTPPAVLDVMSMVKTLELLSHYKKPAAVVLTFCPVQGREVDEMEASIRKLGAMVAPVRMHHRIAHPRAQQTGLTAQELADKLLNDAGDSTGEAEARIALLSG